MQPLTLFSTLFARCGTTSGPFWFQCGADGADLDTGGLFLLRLPSVANRCLFIRADLSVFVTVQDLLLSRSIYFPCIYIYIIMNILWYTYILPENLLLSFFARTTPLCQVSSTLPTICRLWSSSRILMWLWRDHRQGIFVTGMKGWNFLKPKRTKHSGKDFAEFSSRKTPRGIPDFFWDRLVAPVSWWLREYHAVY